METQSLDVPVNGTDVAFIDSPASANMNTETAGKLQTLLSSGIVDGKRRDKLSPDERSWFSKPPMARCGRLTLPLARPDR